MLSKIRKSEQQLTCCAKGNSLPIKIQIVEERYRNRTVIHRQKVIRAKASARDKLSGFCGLAIKTIY